MELLFYSTGDDQNEKRLEADVHKVIPESKIELFKRLDGFREKLRSLTLLPCPGVCLLTRGILAYLNVKADRLSVIRTTTKGSLRQALKKFGGLEGKWEGLAIQS